MADAPAKAAKGVGARLTAKAGPLPVWGWAVLAVGLYFGWRLLAGSSGGSSGTSVPGVGYDTSTPVTSGGSSDAGVGGGSGMGSSVDNFSGDYLQAYGQLVDAYGGINSSLVSALLAGGSPIATVEANGGYTGGGALPGNIAPTPSSGATAPISSSSSYFSGSGYDAAKASALSPAVPAGTTYPQSTYDVGSGYDTAKASVSAASTTTTVFPKQPAPSRYYTYKSQVPLTTNQVLGYTPGKGFYPKTTR